MSGSPCIQCRVSAQTKARLAALARARETTESALLQRLVELALLQAPEAGDPAAVAPVEPVPRGARVPVRLRPEDHVLLRERAAARGLRTATYASMVLRAHLRAVTPLPDREYQALCDAVSELSAVGRNLNQIARVANRTGSASGPDKGDLFAILRALTGLRDHVKVLMRANEQSWESGHAQAHG
jgi:hypothetical protein